MFDRHGYEAYLRSPEWQERRKERLSLDGQRCTGCGSDGSESRLEVHHLTYERLGCERLEDLMTLCHVCHCGKHRRGPSVGIAPAAVPSQEAERAKVIAQRDDSMRRERARQERMSHWRAKKRKAAA